MGMAFEGLDSLLHKRGDAEDTSVSPAMSPAQREGHGLLPNGTPEVTKVGLTDWAANLLFGKLLGLDEPRFLGRGITWPEVLPGYSGLELARKQLQERLSDQ
jgi:hypothetical protein